MPAFTADRAGRSFFNGMSAAAAIGMKRQVSAKAAAEDSPNPWPTPGSVRASACAFIRFLVIPETALAACLLADGRRAWGTSSDIVLATAMCDGEWVGRTAHLDPEGVLSA